MTKTFHILLSLTLLASVVGCDAAKEAADKAQNAAGKAADAAKDMAGIDFGNFDFKGLQEKFSGITSALDGVSGDNVDGLVTKISDLTGSLDSMGIGDLSGPAKAAVGKAISGFVATVQKAIDGMSDDGVLAKLKPVVEPLMEKLKSFTS